MDSPYMGWHILLNESGYGEGTVKWKWLISDGRPWVTSQWAFHSKEAALKAAKKKIHSLLPVLLQEMAKVI